ncbi:MAG TPA: hypothetical protein DDY14_16570 [Chromatiaceae bacterium]|nr:MAG: hypothetical protein N838_06500 [Thiohalocapsa sp. PB-PSB1]HBG96895.1 hypothetical protein [Chromatiaceae bacterium]
MARVLDMDIGTFATDGEKTGVSKVDFIIGGCCYLVLPCRLKHNLAGSLQPERARMQPDSRASAIGRL